jgi:hypothetical protein
MNIFKSNSFTLVALTVSCAFSVNALADLYVSPVNKDSASVNYVKNVVQGERANAQYFPAANNTNPHRNESYQVAQYGQSKVGLGVHQNKTHILMKTGVDIPLFMAMETIVPDFSEWKINYDQGLHDKEVSWSNGNTWQEVLSHLSSNNNIHIELNYSDNVVGISNDLSVARHLSKTIPTVWRLSTDLSLRGNLKTWAKKAGWTVEWDRNLKVDYPVNHDGVFLGDFVGSGGAVDSLIKSYINADTPLKAKFYNKNKVLLITKSGYKQEVSY